MATLRAACLAAAAALACAGSQAHTHRLRNPAVAARRAAFVGAPASAGAVLAGATLSATPARPTSAITNLTVTWSGVPAPQATDWVAQYCVGAPLPDWGQWEYVTASAGWASGAGAVSFIAVRSACDLEFRLYRDPSPYTLLGSSNAVSWGPPEAAYQVRTAFGAEPTTQMTVSWTSAADGPALLMLGAAPGAYSRNITAAPALTYAAEDLCQAPANTVGPSAWQPPGYFHHTLVSGLAPGTRYYARPVQAGAVGAEISFRTAPPPDAPIRFIAYADMAVSAAPGAVETSLRVSQRLDADPDGYAFLIHVGDLGYAEGNVAIWDEWMSYIEPLSSRLPYHVSIGNHEYDYEEGGEHDPSGAGKAWHPNFWNGGVDSGGECGLPTARRFAMPASPESRGVFWYSFSAGMVHVAMISSEHDPSADAPMGAWLAADLAAVDRERTPWVVLGIHRPMYETEEYASDFAVANGLRAILEPLLLKSSVDVVIAGHYHSFFRTCAVANGVCTPGAPVHYTTGAAGASLDNAPLYPGYEYVAKYDGAHFGYSVVTVINRTAMKMEWFWNEDDSLQDEMTLVK